MINSRDKGASGEREFARLIEQHLDVKLMRNLEQSRNGGHDLVVDMSWPNPAGRWLSRFAFEIKRHAKAKPGMITVWWEQTVAQADNAGLVPCLCYREDRGLWNVVIEMAELLPDFAAPNGIDYAATLSVPGFVLLSQRRALPW